MANGINMVQLIGNVGAAPEVRATQGGAKVGNFTLATSESYKKDGVRHEKTEWHRIVVMGDGLCKLVEDWVRKGSRLYVRGKLQTRKWTDQNGIERYTTEVFVGMNGEISLQDPPKGAGGQQTQGRNDDAGAPPTDGGDHQGGGAAGYEDPTGWTPPADDEMPI